LDSSGLGIHPDRPDSALVAEHFDDVNFLAAPTGGSRTYHLAPKALAHHRYCGIQRHFTLGQDYRPTAIRAPVSSLSVAGNRRGRKKN